MQKNNRQFKRFCFLQNFCVAVSRANTSQGTRSGHYSPNVTGYICALMSKIRSILKDSLSQKSRDTVRKEDKTNDENNLNTRSMIALREKTYMIFNKHLKTSLWNKIRSFFLHKLRISNSFSAGQYVH